MLLKSGKKVIVTINKTDSKQYENHKYDFYELGFNTYIEVSGESNLGLYELLDEITKDFNEYEEDEDESIIKFSIIGRPNVGTSSLVMPCLMKRESSSVQLPEQLEMRLIHHLNIKVKTLL